MIRRLVCWWFHDGLIDILAADDETVIAACTKCGRILSHNQAERIWAGQL
jgi:hypothetical protein